LFLREIRANLKLFARQGRIAFRKKLLQRTAARLTTMLDSLLGAHPEVRRFQSAAARALSKIGITADAATLTAVAVGAFSGILFGRGSTMLGIATLALSAGLDAIDGTIARKYETAATPLGGILDLTGDRVVETAVIVGIAWKNPSLYFPALLLVGSWYVNITVFLAVGAALERGGPKLIEYPPGILERTEAIIFFVVLAIVTATGFLAPLGPWLCYLMAALEVVTGVQRLIFGVQALSARPDAN
jgi:archaetidylinositol phosphate synthase